MNVKIPHLEALYAIEWFNAFWCLIFCDYFVQCMKVFTVLPSLHILSFYSLIPKMDSVHFSPQNSTHNRNPMMTKWKKLGWNSYFIKNKKQNYNLHISIHSLCSILCSSTFGNNYNLMSFWVWCYKLGQFLSFFFAVITENLGYKLNSHKERYPPWTRRLCDEQRRAWGVQPAAHTWGLGDVAILQEHLGEGWNL